jgi:Fe2+ transport system protein B
MRVLDVISADFVGRPAANPNGLLSVPVVDAGATKQTQPDKTMSEVITLSQEQHDAKIAELSASHVTALDAVKAEVVALTAKLDEANKANVAALAAKDEAHNKTVAELAEAHKAALAEKDKLIGAAENQSAAKLGIRPLVFSRAAELMAQIPEAGKTDAEKWAQYAELKAKDEAKAEIFYRAHLARK